MAAEFSIVAFTGPALTMTAGVANVDWKTVDDVATPFASAPIPLGTCSMDRWISGRFTGTYNRVGSIRFAHTGGSFGAGLVLHGPRSITTTQDRLVYTTPSTQRNIRLTTDMTAVTSINDGVTVWVGPAEANFSEKYPATTENPAWTSFMTTQLQVKNTAQTGLTVVAEFTVRWVEA